MPDLMLNYIRYQFCQRKMLKVCLLNVQRIFKFYVCLASANVNKDTLGRMKVDYFTMFLFYFGSNLCFKNTEL